MFMNHFQSLTDQYEAKHAIINERLRIKRITEEVEMSLRCGDYSQRIARIRCTTLDCKDERFHPFRSTLFSRTILFAEFMNDRLLPALPNYRQ
jgi:hypothetical protein